MQLFVFVRARDDEEKESRALRSSKWRLWLTNKETGAKTLKEFKRCLVKFDTDKMHFEPILATTKNRDIGYEYF